MKSRTIQQNRAMHKFFEDLADALNDAGYDMRKTLKEGVDIPWSGERVKEFLWRAIQVAVTGKESTAELDRTEVNQVYEILDRHTSQKLGVHVEFPRDELMDVESKESTERALAR